MYYGSETQLAVLTAAAVTRLQHTALLHVALRGLLLYNWTNLTFDFSGKE